MSYSFTVLFVTLALAPSIALAGHSRERMVIRGEYRGDSPARVHVENPEASSSQNQGKKLHRGPKGKETLKGQIPTPDESHEAETVDESSK